MSFAAVYLDHHWVTDVVVGAAYAIAASAAARAILRRTGARRGELAYPGYGVTAHRS